MRSIINDAFWMSRRERRSGCMIWLLLFVIFCLLVRNAKLKDASKSEPPTRFAPTTAHE